MSSKEDARTEHEAPGGAGDSSFIRPGDLELHEQFATGWERFEAGDFAEAERILSPLAASGHFQLSAPAARFIGLGRLASGDRVGAIESLGAAFRSGHLMAAAAAVPYAHALIREGRFAEASAPVAMALRRPEDNDHAMLLLAWLELAAGESQAGLSTLADAVDLAARRAAGEHNAALGMVWFAVGAMLVEASSLEAAAACFLQAGRLGAEDVRQAASSHAVVVMKQLGQL
jgi:hypothetical protein